MLNFTGSTRKRTVNLGNRPRHNKGNFLEQNKIDRQERERQRQREHTATVIIVHVRNFLQLSAQANVFVSSWLHDFDLSPQVHPNTSADVSSDKVDGFNHWARWCAQFRFVTRFGSRTTLDLALVVFDYLSERIKASTGTVMIRDFDLAVLIRSMNKAKDRGISSERYLKGTSNIFHNIRAPLTYEIPVTLTIRNLSECLTQTNIAEILHIVFSVNIADSGTLFFLFFATIPSHILKHFGNYSDILSRSLSASLGELSKFPPAVKVCILENMLFLLQTSDPKAVVVLSEILSTMNFRFVVVPESNVADAKAADKESWDPEINSRTKPQPMSFLELHRLSSLMDSVKSSQCDANVLQDPMAQHFITQKLSQRLKVLTSLNFISQAVRLLSTNHPVLLISLVCHILHVFDESKASVCMMIATIPEFAKWMFARLLRHPVFLEIKEVGLEGDTCPKNMWAGFLEKEHILFWDLLNCYEQFLTYWLIVSKESEGFKDKILNRDDIREFCQFLKTLCLTLIFEVTDVAHVQRIKGLSLSLLSQLHAKNLRLNFLGENFWKLKTITFDIDRLLPAIIEDDQLDDSEYLSDEASSIGDSKKRLSQRRLDVADKLEVFKKVPFFVDFKARVKAFQTLVRENQRSLGTDALFFSDEINAHHVQLNINRETPFEDAFDELSMAGPDLRHKWKVTFHNAHGPEAGIDGGGLTKELLTLIVLEAIKGEKENGIGLLKETELYELYPSEDTYLRLVKGIDVPKQKMNLAYFEFLGMIIGKCLYESVLIDVKFAPFFLAKWKVNQKFKSSVNDLLYVDSNLYRNLYKLLDMSEEELRELDLDFTINEFLDNEVWEYDLLPSGGGQVQVTTSNRLTYVHLVLDFKLNKSLDIQTRHFLNGLYRIIKPNWLNMFDPFELQILIGGVSDIDIDDWKHHVLYGGYFDDDLTITLFWEVVAEMSSEERCELVKFVTSVARAPLLGFGALYPNFGINNSGSPDRLPTASTCHNLLKLPDYRDKKLLREKLLYALHANSGFDLS